MASAISVVLTLAASLQYVGAAPAAPAPTTLTGNPFASRTIYANPYYRSEIMSSAVPALTGTLKSAATQVANVGTFSWLDDHTKVSNIGKYASDIRTQNSNGGHVLGAFVVYDLPDRDCSAAASNGEYSVANNGVALYKQYIDSIRSQLTTYADVPFALVVEPDSLGNMVTNLNVAKCQEAQPAYYECINYALKQLNLPNVAMYLDAGHAGWLGWPANLQPAADLFNKVYTNASSPSSLRGFATNVANYNAWTISSAPSYTQGDPNYDEKLYVNALSPLLKFPAHFITDVSRNGVQPTKQQAWGDWCNLIGTGFGVRPTSNTGDPLEDAFVWVKPGGECDGTSNSSATRFDYHCASSDALQPAPEAGTWFEAYFEQLLRNANPPFSG